MNKINETTKTARCAFAVVLLAGLLLLPGTTRAQLFGGTIIKNSSIIPANLTLAQDRIYFLTSVYDDNYLPYADPTVAATTDTNVNPDGTAETPTVNVQGSITTTGVTVYIPCTATGNGTLPAYSSSVDIDASLTQDWFGRTLVFSWAQQAYTASTKVITAKIKAVTATLNVKKLDLNVGLGSDYLGVLMGTFTYQYNHAGKRTTYQVRDIPGIPDKMFGKYDIGNTTTYEHNFLYDVVAAEDGNNWLNNNLGANYSNINSSSFNIKTQAGGTDDKNAYGSFFQWGRCPDGHELINWTTSTPIYSSTTTLSATDTPSDAKFIYGSTDWRTTPNDALWNGVNGVNNPCPPGYKVPSETQWLVYLNQIGAMIWSNGTLKLMQGLVKPISRVTARSHSSVWGSIVGGFFQLWTCSPSTTNNVFMLCMAPPPYGYNGPFSWYRATGAPVRCLRD